MSISDWTSAGTCVDSGSGSVEIVVDVVDVVSIIVGCCGVSLGFDCGELGCLIRSEEARLGDVDEEELKNAGDDKLRSYKICIDYHGGDNMKMKRKRAYDTIVSHKVQSDLGKQLFYYQKTQ
ncbi:hypothetical protein HDU76_012139 [Blyttiomyces sp. JEL0837]|nr:hypothetical protein HDU76_012139 [Blyttiomyces sp. JEL0837]